MKIIKTASGEKTIKLSKSEWELLGKKAGWVKEAVGSLNRGTYYSFSKQIDPVIREINQDIRNHSFQNTPENQAIIQFYQTLKGNLEALKVTLNEINQDDNFMGGAQ